MTNAPAVAHNQEVATADAGVWAPGQASDFNPRQRDELRALQPGLEKASDADLTKLFTVSKQADLNPYLKEVYLVPRWSGGRTVWATQTSIDGFRKATHRYAESKGLSVKIGAPIFYDDAGNSHPFWTKKFGEHPEAAEVTVSVGESTATVVCTWDEYCQTKKDGNPNATWEKLGPTMLAKCAESGAHRRVCPLTAGLYVDEEMQQADNPVQATAHRQPEQQAPQPVLEAEPVELSDDDERETVLAVLRSATTPDELNGLKDFAAQHLAAHPEDKDAVNTAWMETAKAFQ